MAPGGVDAADLSQSPMLGGASVGAICIWDLKTVPFPADGNPVDNLKIITSYFAEQNIALQEIVAIGNTSDHVYDELLQCGVAFENNLDLAAQADIRLAVSLCLFRALLDGLKLAVIFSGDTGLTTILRVLNDRGFAYVLVYPERVSQDLLGVAKEKLLVDSIIGGTSDGMIVHDDDFDTSVSSEEQDAFKTPGTYALAASKGPQTGSSKKLPSFTKKGTAISRANSTASTKSSDQYCAERFLPLVRELKKLHHNEYVKESPNAIKTYALQNAMKKCGKFKNKQCLEAAHQLNLLSYDGENEVARLTDEGKGLYLRYRGQIIADIMDFRVPVLESVPTDYRALMNAIIDGIDVKKEQTSIGYNKLVHIVQNLPDTVSFGSARDYISAAAENGFIVINPSDALASGRSTLGVTVGLADTLLSRHPSIRPKDVPPQWLPLVQSMKQMLIPEEGMRMSILGSTIGNMFRDWKDLQHFEKFKDLIVAAEADGIIEIDRSNNDWKIKLLDEYIPVASQSDRGSRLPRAPNSTGVAIPSGLGEHVQSGSLEMDFGLMELGSHHHARISVGQEGSDEVSHRRWPMGDQVIGTSPLSLGPDSTSGGHRGMRTVSAPSQPAGNYDPFSGKTIWGQELRASPSGNAQGGVQAGFLRTGPMQEMQSVGFAAYYGSANDASEAMIRSTTGLVQIGTAREPMQGMRRGRWPSEPMGVRDNGGGGMIYDSVQQVDAGYGLLIDAARATSNGEFDGSSIRRSYGYAEYEQAQPFATSWEERAAALPKPRDMQAQSWNENEFGWISRNADARVSRDGDNGVVRGMGGYLASLGSKGGGHFEQTASQKKWDEGLVARAAEGDFHL
ncbi:hypothetical protein BJ742DRAFT_825987 [Cladochytrium replicatum]|nr:hypothetical protein BJ742DRAFT_825987 [Cladochytrium replicatum]